jgi:beta-xylosidase
LDEVTWTTDGWARINNGKGPSRQAPSPLGVPEREEEYNFLDEFNSPTLRFGWQWLQNSVPSYRMSNGFLELSPNKSAEKDPVGGIMAYWTTRGDYAATTMLDATGLKRGELAGVSAYGDAENALGAGLRDGKVVVWRREKNQFRILWSDDAPRSKEVYLRLTARDGIYYDFAVSENGRGFRNVGYEQNGDYLPPWDRGVRVALTVGGAENASARFGFLRIEARRR